MLKNVQHLPSNHPHVRLLSGRTPFFASTADQRFSFGLYVPKKHRFDGPSLPLLVVVHGTRRQTGGYLNKMKDFCDTHNVVLLCPLFPAGIIDPQDINNYKSVLYRDIRYDIILLSMIDQAAITYRIRTDRFYMHGFSGGGQFAHRFLYLHPERLLAVSIGAPGRFTAPDQTLPWPAGIRDILDVFRISTVPDFVALSRVGIQFIVGEKDTDTELLETVHTPTSAEASAGLTRVERIKWLRNAFAGRGVRSTLTVVPGVAHDAMKCLPYVEQWLHSVMAG